MGDRGAIRIKIRIKEIGMWNSKGGKGFRRPWPTKRGKAGEVGFAVEHGRGGARPYRNRERKQPLYSESPTGE